MIELERLRKVRQLADALTAQAHNIGSQPWCDAYDSLCEYLDRLADLDQERKQRKAARRRP
jgi:hypothetical protein